MKNVKKKLMKNKKKIKYYDNNYFYNIININNSNDNG